MTKRARSVLGVGAALGLAALVTRIALPAEAPPATPAERAIFVATSLVTQKDVLVTVEGLGNVTSLATVTVRSRVDGRLDRIVFREGQAVKAGDLLAVVDPRPFVIQRVQGEAALARDRANLDNARKNLSRYEKLRQGDLIPQMQVDDQRTAVAQLDAATLADKAQIESAQLNIEYAYVTSPVTGITGVRLVDRGNVVHAADPTGIVLVTQLEPIALVFTVAQDRLGQIQRALERGKPQVEAFARNGTERLGEGNLETIDNQVNAQTATIRLKATMPNPGHRLWPNQFVKARLHVDTLEGAIVVPALAIQRGPPGTFAYVVAADQTVSTRAVTVLSIEGDEAVVEKGLAPGEVVVTEGQSLLRPGVRVAPRAPVDAGPPPGPVLQR